jgi:two-component system CheB/CheR fusion protein
LQDANEELQAANEEMMLAQEELQATNEEIEATNEELQATNEELETGNEELQATNEELETTNEELTERTNELIETGKSLADERVRFTEMVELAPFYIMLLRGPGFVIEASNARPEGLLGGREAIGQPFAEIFAEPEMAELVNLAREAYREDQLRATSRILTRLLNGRGKVVENYFIYTIVPTHDSEKKVNGLVIYAEDVTGLQAREAAERLEHLKIMIDNARQMALGLYDAETMELLQASPLYLDKLEFGYGYAPDQIIGRKWPELTFSDPDEAVEIFKSVVEASAPSRQVELRIKMGDSETIWNRVLTPIRFGGNEGTGKVSFILFSAVEITEQVRAREQLEQLDFLKDQFFSLASHELRTPLVPLMGYSEALTRLISKPPAAGEEIERDQKILHMANKFRGQLKHLERLTDDLLDMSRLQSGKFSLQSESVDLTRVADMAIEAARLTAPARTIRLDARKNHQPLIVRGDEGRLLQVMNNLLNNAIVHAPQSDRIDLQLSRTNTDSGPPQAQVEVRDYGPGIPPDDMSTVFSPFYQISDDKRRPRSGLGLGLYIAKNIIEQHGGEITIQSKPGDGSAFIFRLPLIDAGKVDN